MQLIDVHSHYITPYQRDVMARVGQLDSDLLPVPPWELEKFMETMVSVGITHSVLSVSSPNQSFGDKALALELTRESNETGAEYVRKYTNQLSLAAALPLPYVGESLEEIKYAFDTLGVKAVRILSNSLGVYPGCPETEPVFAELGRRKAVVILHPTRPQSFPDKTLSSATIPLFEFHVETCRAVINLILSGTIRRYPGIRFIVPHCGAVIIPLLERVDRQFNVYRSMHEDVPPVDVMKDAATLYFDIAGDPLPRQLDTLLTFADPGHILYGTDYPWKPADSAKRNLTELAEKFADGLFAELLFHKNAQALFS